MRCDEVRGIATGDQLRIVDHELYHRTWLAGVREVTVCGWQERQIEDKTRQGARLRKTDGVVVLPNDDRSAQRLSSYMRRR